MSIFNDMFGCRECENVLKALAKANEDILRANNWLSILYLVVTKLGKDYKLIIENTKEFPVPLLSNLIHYNYDKETDILTITIEEEVEKKIIGV